LLPNGYTKKEKRESGSISAAGNAWGKMRDKESIAIYGQRE
jgi:hypothetical protein